MPGGDGLRPKAVSIFGAKFAKPTIMRKLTADYVFPVDGAPIREGVVIVDDAGAIVALSDRADHDPASLEVYAGALIPGFVNTHCHLELSHLKGRVGTGTGLLPFLQGVVSLREVPREEIDAAIDAADREMYEGGIVAVGDISNKLDTAACKAASGIRYYTFVEMFDFLQDDWAEHNYEQYHAVYQGQADGNGNAKSAVPHAPYTVSKSLFARINQLNGGQGVVSIHNQETPPENELFLQGTGGFLDFYRAFNIPLEGFKATGQTAIHYALNNMDPRCRTLFVHNTLSTPHDIAAAQAWNPHTYWATCPNANLYIENRLPNYRYFMEAGARLTIGTDSLTSNWQLSILEEMKTIHRYQSYVPFAELLRWATLNGAEALGFDDSLGSIAPGKRPGLLWMSGLEGQWPEDFRVTQETRVKRLA